jgi:hypothetical protein
MSEVIEQFRLKNYSYWDVMLHNFVVKNRLMTRNYYLVDMEWTKENENTYFAMNLGTKEI